MKKKKAPVADAFYEKFIQVAIKSKAEVAISSMRECKKFSEGDLYVVFAAKGADRFEVVRAFVEQLEAKRSE